MTSRILIAGLGLSLAGCALGTRTYRIHPVKPTIALRTDTVFVISAPPEEIEIRAIEHFRDDFGSREGDKESEMLAAFFDSAFLAHLNESVRYPNFAAARMPRSAETGFPFRILLDSGGKHQLQLRFWVPHHKELAARGIHARYILTVAGLEFRSLSNPQKSLGRLAGGSRGHAQAPRLKLPVPHMGGGEGEGLTLSLIYLLWDYRANDYVACGIAEGASKVLWAITKGNWRDLVQEAAQSLLRKTPLKPFMKPPPGSHPGY